MIWSSRKFASSMKKGCHRATANQLPPGSTFYLLFTIAGPAAFCPLKSVAVASSLNRPCSRAQEMCGFCQEQGYPSDLLRENLRKTSASTGTTPPIATERKTAKLAGYHWYLLTTPSMKKSRESYLTTSGSLTTTQRPGGSFLTARS